MGNLLAWMIVIGAAIVWLKSTAWLIGRARRYARVAYHYSRRRVTRQTTEYRMKWKKSVVADRYFDFLLQLEIDGILTKQDRKAMMSDFAKRYNILDLLPRKWHENYLAYRKNLLKSGKAKLAGPKAGASLTGEPITKIVSHSAFLEAQRTRKTA